ncbi:MAG: hypothetical protein NTZ74_10915 [Chloroflexi bacterium]|nr:hypothetical protein [Chloroflexota bacterium]
MSKFNYANIRLIKTILILQFIPIFLFPLATFELTSQAWWLPLILVILAIVGVVQVFRKSVAAWPLYLISFAHGFNIISRLMMLMPQFSQGTNGKLFNGQYLVLSILSMAASTFVLWYVEKPDVKQQLMK